MQIPFSSDVPTWDSWFKEEPSHALLLWKLFVGFSHNKLSLSDWREAGMQLAKHRAPLFSLQVNSSLPVIFELVLSSGSTEEDEARQKILFEVLAHTNSAFPHATVEGLPNRMEWWGFIVQHFGQSVFWRSGPVLPAFLDMLEKSELSLRKNMPLKLFLKNNVAYWQYEKEGVIDNAQYWFTKIIFWAAFLKEREALSQKKMSAQFFEPVGHGKMPNLDGLLHNLTPLSPAQLAKIFFLWREMMGDGLSESAALVIETANSIIEDACGEGAFAIYGAWRSSSSRAGMLANLPLLPPSSVTKI